MKRNNTARLTRRAALAKKNASKRQRDESTRRKAMGVGLIERPLKFIVKHKAWSSPEAIAAANTGNGNTVRSIAFDVLRVGR